MKTPGRRWEKGDTTPEWVEQIIAFAQPDGGWVGEAHYKLQPWEALEQAYSFKTIYRF